MKKDMLDTLEFFASQIKQYGLLICIGMVLYFGFKKALTWIVMPWLLLSGLKQIGVILNWDWVSKINLFGLVAIWIFVIYGLKIIGKTCFEERK